MGEDSHQYIHAAPSSVNAADRCSMRGGSQILGVAELGWPSHFLQRGVSSHSPLRRFPNPSECGEFLHCFPPRC